MKRARWGVFALSTIVALVVIVAGFVAAQLGDVVGPARVEISPGVVGIATGESYAYVLIGATGIVLIDTGSDHTGRALLAELARVGKSVDDVKAVALTSAHPFTTGGLDILPNVPVYVGADDVEVARQPRLAHAPLARIIGRLKSHRRHDNPMVPVAAGARLLLEGIELEAIATPGVTSGARTYLVGDVAFVGASVVARDGHLRLPSMWLADQREDIVASMQRLSAHSFNWLAGARFAPTREGRAMYDSWQKAIPDEQRVSAP